MKDGITTTEFWLQAVRTLLTLGLNLAVAWGLLFSGQPLDGIQAIAAVIMAAIALAIDIKGQLGYTQSRTTLKLTNIKSD